MWGHVGRSHIWYEIRPLSPKAYPPPTQTPESDQNGVAADAIEVVVARPAGRPPPRLRRPPRMARDPPTISKGLIPTYDIKRRLLDRIKPVSGTQKSKLASAPKPAQSSFFLLQSYLATSLTKAQKPSTTKLVGTPRRRQ